MLVPEAGQAAPAARVAFQVHFVELRSDHMAIGGLLLSDMPLAVDLATIDICVMAAAWPKKVRKQVTESVLAAMAQACKLAEASPT